jgi:hypothetical protein
MYLLSALITGVSINRTTCFATKKPTMLQINRANKAFVRQTRNSSRCSPKVIVELPNRSLSDFFAMVHLLSNRSGRGVAASRSARVLAPRPAQTPIGEPITTGKLTVGSCRNSGEVGRWGRCLCLFPDGHRLTRGLAPGNSSLSPPTSWLAVSAGHRWTNHPAHLSNQT